MSTGIPSAEVRAKYTALSGLFKEHKESIKCYK